MRLLRGWGFLLLLAFLAVFVVFVECLADIGGSREAVPIPVPPTSSPEAEDREGSRLQFEDDLGVVVANERSLRVVGDPGLLCPAT
jgi:hypothetical protein